MQAEFALTQVLGRPVTGRLFFEAAIRENLDLGRPEQVQLVFDRKIIGSTPGRFRTRVIETGVNPNLYIEYKKSMVKQYFKENRALRTETIINDPKDFGGRLDLSNLPFLQKIGREVNRRLLDVQRVSHNCHLSQESVERVVQPTLTAEVNAPLACALVCLALWPSWRRLLCLCITPVVFDIKISCLTWLTYWIHLTRLTNSPMTCVVCALRA